MIGLLIERIHLDISQLATKTRWNDSVRLLLITMIFYNNEFSLAYHIIFAILKP